jgi:hypothetical protein
MRLIDCRRIWDQAPHSAFTDLERFGDSWYCTFREGRSHWAPGAAGKIRVIRSDGGDLWESTALISAEGDLRDPKLCVTPDGELMLTYFRRFNPHRFGEQDERQYVQFSTDGTTWSSAVPIGFPNQWLWRVTWHDGRAYGLSRGGPADQPPFTRPQRGDVLVSRDGRSFGYLAGAPDGGEATFRFSSQASAYCLLRGEENRAWWGTASPPYTHWQWRTMNVEIGGPDFTILPDATMVAVVRLYDGRERTSVCRLDPERAELEEVLALPSAGDTSYAGIVRYDGVLWVSYYSSHEEKTAVYLARVDPAG